MSSLSSLSSMPELRGASAQAFSLPNPIASLAASTLDHPVLCCDDASFSAAHLADEVARRAARLAAQGLRPGDGVALLGVPSLDWVLTFHAVGWLGGVAICLAPSDTPAENSRRIVESDALPLWHRAFALGSSDSPRPGRGVKLLCADAPWLERLADDGELSLQRCQLSLADLPAAEAPLPERFWPLEEPRAVVYTSGTTARPRAQTLTSGQLAFAAFGSAVRLGHDPRDRWLCCMPLHHVAGISILLRCAFMGTCVLLHPRFEAEAVARALDRGEASLVSLVPTMLQRVLDARPERPFPESLRAILLGGAPAEEALVERCRSLQAPVSLTWGTSETASQICTRAPGDLAPEGGVGLPLPFARIGLEGAGQLAVRGPIAAGGRVLSRDLGHFDELGRVHVEGRVDDVIISGGEKILPSEIEAALGKHEAVVEAGVVGRADHHWGARPVAFVVANDTSASSQALREALLSHCRGALPGYKVPDAFVFVDSLPRTENGKLQRALLRARLEEEPPEESQSPVPRPAKDGLLERFARAAEERIDTLPPTLAELRRHYADDLQAVTTAQLAVVEEGQEAETSTERAAHHLLRHGGKQLRALCTLLCAELVPAHGAAPSATLVDRLATRRLAARQLAAAAELAHNATLLHDDVIDQGEERRGAKTSRVVYGNKASVLAGDHLLTASLVKVEEHGGAELLSRMLDVLRTMVVGEALQFEHEGRLSLDAATYLRIIESKTAALFGWCLRAGGSLAGLPPTELELLEDAGRHFGIAFQLVDDLLDIDGDPKLLGKGRLLDLAEGKLTWPVLIALHQSPSLADELSARIFSRLGEDGAHPDQNDLETLATLIRGTDAIEQTRREARARTTLAHDALLQLAASPAQRVLLQLIELCAERAR